MKTMYQHPGMFSYPVPPGAYPLFENAHQPYFYGFVPPGEGSSQPLYPFPSSNSFYGESHFGNVAYELAFENLSLNPSAPEYVPGSQAWMPSPRAQPQDRQRSAKQQRAGKGFFSSGRVDGPTWRNRGGPSSPEHRGHRAVNKGNSSNVKRTIYITDVDQQITEEQLATFFKDCGEVMDCRVCGDPNSAMRFAFIEFGSDSAAEEALKMNGQVLGDFPLRVLPSKTAIVPVNNQYLPKNTREREQCSRTIYAANIDKKVDRESVKRFFETLCGPVNRIRLLGDWQHTTRIAFVEFVKAESAKKALSCSGALLGSLPVRVSPSKTPVRDEAQGVEREAPQEKGFRQTAA